MSDPLDNLFKALSAASATFHGTDDDSRNKGKQAALTAVLGFLAEVKAEPIMKAPLYQLLSDHDATSGKELKEAIEWAEAAAVVDILIGEGLSLKDSIKQVVRATGGKLNKAALENFRKNVRSGRCRDEAKAYYLQVMEINRGYDFPNGRRKVAALELVRERFGQIV